MTPLAVRLFREGYEDEQRRLAASQFFECTSLVPLALEMQHADAAAGYYEYSRSAQLPAPSTALEFVWVDARLLILAVQDGDRIEWEAFGPFNGELHFLFACGFVLGTPQHLTPRWNSDFLTYWSHGRGDKDEWGSQHATGFSGVIVRMLCMINDTGLLEMAPRDTDKRVVRLAAGAGVVSPAPRWHECRIRPGVHGRPGGDKASHREHQLHYVRKHRKPSLGPDRWVDGYWRGNADLGIHHKYYNVVKRLAG